MWMFLVALLAFILAPDAAHAGPVFMALVTNGVGFGAALGQTALGGFLATTGGRLMLSVAFSALQSAMGRRPKPPGIVTEVTLTGSKEPLSFIIGKYATGGVLQGPIRSHGTVSGIPNAYRNYIITLGAIPRMRLSRLILNGEYVELGTTVHADYGLPVLGRYEGFAWVKYYDGTQTAADPMLLAKYGSDPDRPWTADMVGTGLCYAILTFRRSDKVFPSGEPAVRFEMLGIPLYDPRKDTTVGGSGTHRWNNTATWEHSENPQVQSYNIKRGIELPGLGVWGGKIPASDLPLSHWFAAMNICDQTVTRPGGGTEPRFRTGYEIKVNQEPADIIEELNKASATQIAEVGGIWKPRTGGPGLPVYFMTDDDIIITSPQDMDPFPGSDTRYNGIKTEGPNPEAVWEPEPDPELYNTAWETEDGGQRRMAELPLPACPYSLQRQRVGRAYIKDERRFLRYQHTLPSDAAILEPLDVLAWTSARNGYVNKHFEIGEMQDDVVSLQQAIAQREVDPTDFEDPPGYGEVPLPVPTTRRPIAAQTLAGFNATGGTTTDAAGNPRRPHAHLVWSGADQDGVTGIEWEIRLLAGGVHVARGSTSQVTAGSLRVFDGILPNTSYQARAQQIAPWPVAWTAWVSFNSSSARLTGDDLSDEINASIAEGQQALEDAAAVRADHDALTADFAGDLKSAFAEQAARAMANGGGWLKDPTFSDWVSGNLNINNWAGRSGTSAYALEGGGDFGGGMTVNAPSGTALVDIVASTAASSGLIRADATADYVALEFDIEYTAGDPAGVAFRVEWSSNGTTWTRGTFNGQTQDLGLLGADYGIAPQPGVRQSIRALWKRPAGVSGHMRLRMLPKLSTVNAAQQMVIHYTNLRRATRAEIDAGETYLIASFNPGQTVAYTGVGAAIAGLNTAFSARAGGLEANVTNILGARADLLAGTALATLLTQLQVNSGNGLSAWVATQSTAITSLANKVAASYVLRVGAGGAGAGLELVAQDDAVSGASSALKLRADQIGLYGDVQVSAGNLYPDFDMMEEGFYSTPTAADYGFLEAGSASLGRRFLSIAASDASEQVLTGWFPVEPNTEYLVSGFAFMSSAAAGSGTSQLALVTGSVNGAGVVTALTAHTVKNVTDNNSVASGKGEVSITTGPEARRGRFRLTRPAGGTAAARAGGFRVDKKVGAKLTVDGLLQALAAQITEAWITRAHLNNAIIGAAQIENLSVGTLQLTDNAVTNGVGANDTSASGTTTTAALTSSRDITISCIAGSPVSIWMRGAGRVDGGTRTGTLRVRWNGTVIYQKSAISTPDTPGGVLSGEDPVPGRPEWAILDDILRVTAVGGVNTLRYEFDVPADTQWSRTFGPAMLLELKK